MMRASCRLSARAVCMCFVARNSSTRMSMLIEKGFFGSLGEILPHMHKAIARHIRVGGQGQNSCSMVSAHPDLMNLLIAMQASIPSNRPAFRKSSSSGGPQHTRSPGAFLSHSTKPAICSLSRPRLKEDHAVKMGECCREALRALSVLKATRAQGGACAQGGARSRRRVLKGVCALRLVRAQVCFLELITD